MKARTVAGLALLAALSAVSAGAQEPQVLSVCLQSNEPPISARGGGKPDGFAYALSRSIADRLGMKLRVQWFVSRDDNDASFPKETNALLSDHRCALVAEFPLLADALEHPRSPTAKLPPFDGATPEDRTRWVPIGDLAATRPYRSDALIVVLSPRDAGRHITRLADLSGMQVGVPIATLADAITADYGNGRLIENIHHLANAPELFGELQDGRLDAAFVDARSFDAWRLKHPASTLVPSGYRHSIAFNVGFVGLASDRDLIDKVDSAIGEMQAHDQIAPLAAESGLTFAPPNQPAITPRVSLSALAGD